MQREAARSCCLSNVRQAWAAIAAPPLPCSDEETRSTMGATYCVAESATGSALAAHRSWFREYSGVASACPKNLSFCIQKTCRSSFRNFDLPEMERLNSAVALGAPRERPGLASNGFGAFHVHDVHDVHAGRSPPHETKRKRGQKRRTVGSAYATECPHVGDPVIA